MKPWHWLPKQRLPQTLGGSLSLLLLLLTGRILLASAWLPETFTVGVYAMWAPFPQGWDFNRRFRLISCSEKIDLEASTAHPRGPSNLLSSFASSVTLRPMASASRPRWGILGAGGICNDFAVGSAAGLIGTCSRLKVICGFSKASAEPLNRLFARVTVPGAGR